MACITDLMVKEGLINLDFADVRAVMANMGTALMGTGEAEGDKRALQAAEAAITNPLLGEVTMRGAKGLLVSITGSYDMTLYEVEEAASRIRREVDPDENPDVNIIVGATFDAALQRRIRVSVVATGIRPGGDYVQTVPNTHATDRRGSLGDRLYGNDGARGAREQMQPGNARQERGDGGRRVQLEPKGKGGFGPSADSPSGFEPVAPSKTARAPKRPLTYSDFPELHQGGDDHQGQTNRNPSKPRGFFDWMAGRNKGSQKAAATNPGQKTVTLQPRLPHEKNQIEPELNGHRSGFAARAPLVPDGNGFDGGDAPSRYQSGEVADIPGFLRGRSAKEGEMH